MCPNCALPSPAGARCGGCLRKAPPFIAATAAWRYAFPVDRLLQAFKYGNRLALADPLSAGLIRALEHGAAEAVDAVIALPLSPRRQRERGFNQAEEIACRVARSLELPLLHDLRRSRDGPPQASLRLRERARLVRGAFEAGGGVRGKRIALVDDVMTTGATLAGAAHALRIAGASEVRVWVVARTLPRGQEAAGGS